MAIDMAGSGYLGAFNIPSPTSIAYDGGSRLYIGSSGGIITVTSLDGDLITTYGGRGSELEGVLSEPVAMFYSDGRLYVVDSLRGHVLVLTPEGGLVHVFGRRGHGDKQFLEPGGLYVRGGLIYVADTGNASVRILGRDGVYQGRAGTSGNIHQKLISPVDVAVAGSGDIYVVDDKREKLLVYDALGVFRRSFIGLRSPVAVSFISNLVAVSDAHGATIKIFTAEGKPVVSLKALTLEAGLSSPVRCMAAVGDVLYACDTSVNRVVGFRIAAADASYEHKPTPAVVPYAEYLGAVPLGMDRPGKVSGGPDGRLYVLEQDAGRIVTISREGGVSSVVDEGCRASGFAIGGEGDVYCLDARGGRVVISSPGGGAAGVLDLRQRPGCQHVKEPVDLDVSVDGEVFIADRRAGAVFVYGPDGDCLGALGMGGTSFYIKEPVAVRLDGKGLVYVADRAMEAILIYSTSGRLIRTVAVKGVRLDPGGFDISDRFIFLLDRAGGRVRVLSKSGLALAGFGSAGQQQGEFASPQSVFVMDDGSIVISDHAGGGRVQRFAFHITGAMIERIKGSGVVKGHKSHFVD